MQNRSISRKIYIVGFIIIQIEFRKGKSSISHTRGMCRSDNYLVPFKFVCRSPGVVKTYLTMADKFFIPDLMHYLHSYNKGCHICQLSKKDKIPNRQFQKRINLNYRPLSRLSMDLKVMPKSHRGHKFILCVIDEMTNYLITMPIHQARSEEIGDALIDNVI